MSRSRLIPAQRPGVAAGGQPPVGADLGKESRDPYRLRRIQDLGAQLGSKIDLPSNDELGGAAGGRNGEDASLSASGVCERDLVPVGRPAAEVADLPQWRMAGTA